jgi:serine/threonine protein kinase
VKAGGPRSRSAHDSLDPESVMTATPACPAPAALQEYLLGLVPEEAAALMEAHLSSCPDCRKLLPTIRAEDELVAAFRAQARRPTPRNALLDRLAEGLRGLLSTPPTGHDATPSAALEATPSAAGAATDADEDVCCLLAPPQQPDEMGRLGDYRVLKLLGSGGMGVVFLAEDVRLRRRVALKAMRPALAANPKARERFLREAQLTASLTHDHVIAVHQVGEEKGVPFLAMPLLQGESLDARLKREGPLPLADVLRIGRETAEGLAAAHGHGLTHRDIKPANLWLEALPGERGASAPRYRVKVLDFGLARSGDGDAHLTQSGVVVGTPAYMAPEQGWGGKVDPRSDLFSLGCVLYKLCTGRTPFPGDSPLAVLRAAAMDHPKPVRELDPAVPPGVADLVMRLLEKDPARRPASAREVGQILDALEKDPAQRLAGDERTELLPPPDERTEMLPPPAAPPGAAPRPMARRRLALIIAAAVVVAGLTGLCAAALLRSHTDRGNHITKTDDKATTSNPHEAVDDAWVEQVAAGSAEEQVKAVAAKLKDVNPGFDGKATPTINNGVLTGLELLTDDVTDISPVRALTELKVLICNGSAAGKGRLTDLSALKGMKLTNLMWTNTRNINLSSLQGLPLRQLNCGDSNVSDLSPLQGLPLQVLSFQNTPVSDLRPLIGMRLSSLDCSGTQVTDLWPLAEMPLGYLICRNTPVDTLAPLSKLRLTYLDCRDTKLTDFSPVKRMPLTMLYCDFIPQRDAEVLGKINSLERINDKPAKDFLKEMGETKPD